MPKRDTEMVSLQRDIINKGGGEDTRISLLFESPSLTLFVLLSMGDA